MSGSDVVSKSPHVFRTPECGELTFTLENLYTHFTKSRFAIELFSSRSFLFNEYEVSQIIYFQ